jgi:ArsR family transcriptional regulator, arsenate/arsenite/antimonite-responsive transcriptional repressor / arsenate reductase (thioredoxin)
MDFATRAERHSALGDERRLQIVDELALTDRTFAELQAVVDLPSNLLAHHLVVLESAGLISRRVSEGDRRRRYISLDWEALPVSPHPWRPTQSSVAFVCTRNSARSQFAAAMWNGVTGSEAASAGSDPARSVHPTAVRVAEEFGVDISTGTPSGYGTLPEVDLIVSVCDRANESGVPRAEHRMHWSVPDPVEVGSVKAFRSAFADIARRLELLAVPRAGSSTQPSQT